LANSIHTFIHSIHSFIISINSFINSVHSFIQFTILFINITFFRSNPYFFIQFTLLFLQIIHSCIHSHRSTQHFCQSGKIVSTEDTYKYHIQVQDEPAAGGATPKSQSTAPLKGSLKSARTAHNGTHNDSDTSLPSSSSAVSTREEDKGVSTRAEEDKGVVVGPGGDELAEVKDRAVKEVSPQIADQLNQSSVPAAAAVIS